MFHRFTKQIEISSLCDGEVIPITEVQDLAFQSEVLGKGVGILSKETTLYAPIDGIVSVVFPTKHAYGITTKEGIEVLIHIGIDTVELQGEGFQSKVQQGDKMKQGDVLCNVDFAYLESSGYDGTIMVVITNTKDCRQINIRTGKINKNECIMTITK